MVGLRGGWPGVQDALDLVQVITRQAQVSMVLANGLSVWGFQQAVQPAAPQPVA
jgi:hypothetical protein